MSEQYYTVVYRVEGGHQSQDEWWQSIQKLFLVDGPVKITEIAAGDLLNVGDATDDNPHKE